MIRFAFEKGHPSCSLDTGRDTGRDQKQRGNKKEVKRVKGNGVQNAINYRGS